MTTIKLYFIMAFSGFILWIPFPELVHFMGPSSLYYALLFAIGIGRSLMSCLALTWILLCIIALTFGYIMARRKQMYTPFILIVSLELAVSLLFAIFKITSANYTDLKIILIGFCIRLLYYMVMLYLIYHLNTV